MTLLNNSNKHMASILSRQHKFVSIAAACAESEVAKDFFTSAYSSPYTLDLIRKNDTQKTKIVFGNFCNDFSEDDWIATESVVSGIEYGAMTVSKEKAELRIVIEKALNAIMLLYGVPEHLRVQNIDRALSLDYRELGRSIFREFNEYIDRINEITEI